ncbi:MAG: hypothetical protein J6K96_04030 [Treponema sp.]|nr:hypothetical protein [Treponema sp.]
MEVIDQDAFRYCKNLTELIIPENLTKLIFIDQYGNDSTNWDPDQKNFEGTSNLPLITQKRLRDLGYKGSFLSSDE